jgi:hypothetical protein
MLTEFWLGKDGGRRRPGDVVNQCSEVVWNALWNRAQISLGCCIYGDEPEGVWWTEHFFDYLTYRE